MQHEVARRLSGLHHLFGQFDALEGAHLMTALAAGLAVDLDRTTGQQALDLLAIEGRQVAEEAVKTHGDTRAGAKSGDGGCGRLAGTAWAQAADVALGGRQGG